MVGERYGTPDNPGYGDNDLSNYSPFAVRTHRIKTGKIKPSNLEKVAAAACIFSLVGGALGYLIHEKKGKQVQESIKNIYHILGPEHVKKISKEERKVVEDLLGAVYIGVKFDNPYIIAEKIVNNLHLENVPHEQKKEIVKEVCKTVGAYQQPSHLSLMDIGKYLYNECKQDIGNKLKSLEGYLPALAKKLIKNPLSSGKIIKPDNVVSYAGNNTTIKINETGLKPYNTTLSRLNETIKNMTKTIKKKLPGFNITEISTKGKWENQGYAYIPSSAKKVKIGELIKSIERYLGFGNNTEKYITLKEVPFHLAEYNQTSGKTTRINGTILAIESTDHPVIYNLTSYTHENLQKIINVGNKIKQIKSDYVTIGINPVDYIRGIKTNSTKLNQTIMNYIAPLSENMTNITALKNSTTPEKIYQSLKRRLDNSSLIFIKGPENNPYLGSKTKLAYLIKINKTVKKPIKWLKKNIGIFNFVTKDSPELTVSNTRDMKASLIGGNGGHKGASLGSGGSTGGFGGGGGSGTGGSMES